MEEVPTVVDEITVSRAVAVEATIAVEPADNVTVAAETTGDATNAFNAFEE